MKKILLLLFFFPLFALAENSRIDTVYYDGDKKGVASKEFATYVAYFSFPADSCYKRLVKLVDLKSSQTVFLGEFVHYDKYEFNMDDFFNCKSYYKNGKLKFEQIGDTLDCTLKEYYPNGKIKQITPFKGGKINGEVVVCGDENDVTKYFQFENGKVVGDWTMDYCGVKSKYSSTKHTQIFDSVSVDDRSFYKSKKYTWQRYCINGIQLSARCYYRKEYGSYWCVPIVLCNYGNNSLNFNVYKISAYIIKNGKRKNLKVYDLDSYMLKVQVKQANQKFALSFANSLADNLASTSYATTKTTFGKKTFTTTTRYFDSYAYQEASRRSAEEFSRFNAALLEDQETLSNNYLKSTSLSSGETLSGFINLKYVEQFEELNVSVILNNQEYLFTWTNN